MITITGNCIDTQDFFRKLLLGTGYFGVGRVWRWEAVPAGVQTYPFATITDLSDATIVLQGDSSEIAELRNQYQIDLWLANAKSTNPNVRRDVIKALMNAQGTVNNESVRTRFLSANKLSGDDEAVRRESITTLVFAPVNAI